MFSDSQKKNIPHTTDLIDKAIEIALTTFIPGPKNTKRQTSQKHMHFVRDTHAIPDCQFIAGRGPKDLDDLNLFFKDILEYSREGQEITHVIALGKHLSKAKKCPKGADFLNYYIHDEEKQTDTDFVAKLIKGRATSNDEEATPLFFAQFELSIKLADAYVKSLIISGIELKDCHALDLSDDTDDEKKAALWELYQEVKDKLTFVHCKHGRGRTGHLIFIFLILDHYDEIFSSDDPAIIAANLHRLLDHLRKERPGLVHTAQQFYMAVTNAFFLREFGLQLELEKKQSTKPAYRPGSSAN